MPSIAEVASEWVDVEMDADANDSNVDEEQFHNAQLFTPLAHALLAVLCAYSEHCGNELERTQLGFDVVPACSCEAVCASSVQVLGGWMMLE